MAVNCSSRNFHTTLVVIIIFLAASLMIYQTRMRSPTAIVICDCHNPQRHANCPNQCFTNLTNSLQSFVVDNSRVTSTITNSSSTHRDESLLAVKQAVTRRVMASPASASIAKSPTSPASASLVKSPTSPASASLVKPPTTSPSTMSTSTISLPTISTSKISLPTISTSKISLTTISTSKISLPTISTSKISLPTISTSAVSTSTTMTPSVPERVLNVDNCINCFEGKVLVATQKGWLCGQARFGNKLFMMAPAIAAAAKYNATFVLVQGDKQCEWVEWLQKLFITFNTTTPLLPYSMMKDWKDEGEPGFTQFKPIELKNRNLTISGYRQSWKYFSSDMEKTAVRETLKFAPKYETKANEIIRKARNNFTSIDKPIYIGLHMRIGDLLNDDRLEYGYVAANSTFYSIALKVASSYFNQSNSIIFIIASDSPKQAKKLLGDLGNVYNIYWSGGTAYEDFATLSKCNHSIISGGTYGFWTAWLTGGKTFYFSKFAKPGSKFFKGFVSDNFYLPDWIPVGWTIDSY